MKNRKIKIDYIIPTLDKGGAERFFIDLLKHLDLNKFAPRLVLYKKGGDWLEEIKYLSIDFVVLEKKNKIALKNFYSLYKTIKKRKPDIVHTQLGGDIYGVLAARLSGIKKIITTEVNTNQDESFLYNLIKRISLKFVTMVVAVSLAVASDARKRYKLRSEKVIVLYNGIDLNRFIPAPEKNLLEFSKRRSFVFGSVGRLSEQKGYIYLIQAMAKIRNNRIKLKIAGDGYLREKLEEEIKKNNFREDLYHRLSVILISVPSLNERIDDLPLLANHFIELICGEMGMPAKSIDNQALEELKKINYTGNIREFRNIIERLIILGQDKISVQDVKSYTKSSS